MKNNSERTRKSQNDSEQISENENLGELEKRASELLIGKTVCRIMMPRENEIVIEFNDGTRLFCNVVSNDLDISIT